MLEKKRLRVPSMGREDPLEEGASTHSSILAWRNPWRNLYIHVCIYVYICMCVYMCMCICVCVHICVCVYMCVCLRTYIHTHMHIRVHSQSLKSCLTLCSPMDCSHQAPLSLGLSRQEYSPAGDLPHRGIEPWVSYVSNIGRPVLYH